MARSQEPIVPTPGRFGLRQAPYTRMFRGERRRLNRARRIRRLLWLAPVLPVLIIVLYDELSGSLRGRDLIAGLPRPAVELWVPDAPPVPTGDTGLRTAGEEANPPQEPTKPDLDSIQTAALPPPGPLLTGPARVIDGDTLQIGGARIRIAGIDAPEAAQTCRHDGNPWRCGAAAAAFLNDLTEGHSVSCDENATGRDGRGIGRCWVGGLDLGAEMVRAGLALADRRHSERYVPEEIGARLEKRGLWATDFEAPWEWRRGR